MNLGIPKGQTKRTGRNTHWNLKLAFKNDTEVTNLNREERELLKSIVDARKEWLEAIANFENVYEEKLIDYYTYKMKACEARYTFFIMEAKEKGLKGFISQETGQYLIPGNR